jgi:hypothetical protein
MTTYPASLGVVQLPDRTFRPVGPIYEHGPTLLSAKTSRRDGDELLSARFFVGMNVNRKPRWTMEDVIAIVTRLQPAGASFVAQRGVWISKKRGREEEDSAQVLIMNTAGKSRRQFVREMRAVAEALVDKLKQEAVYLDIQDRGVVVEAYTSTPGRKGGRR